MRGRQGTPEEKKELVRNLVYLNPFATHEEISEQSGVPRRTVSDLLSREGFLDEDKFTEFRHLKKAEFIQSAWQVIEKTLQAASLKVDKLISNPESLDKANVRDIAVALGTIYDKQALASGEPTIISDKQEASPDLVKKMEEKLSQLKRLTGT